MNITSPSNFETITLIQCINVIIRTFASNEDLISESGFSSKLDFPSIKTNYKKKMLGQFSTLKPNIYLIQEDDEQKLQKLLEILGNITNPSFNPRGKFLFISRKFPEELPKYLASLYIVDAIFLNAVTKEIHTYFPYARRSLNAVNTTLEKLGKCEDVPNINLFPPKIPKSWENSTVSIHFRKQDAYAMCYDCQEKGIDIDMLNVILDHTCITGKYGKEHYKLDKDILTRFNINIGNYSPKHGTNLFGEFSMSYTEDAVVWLIPAPDQISRWKYFLEIFEIKVWIASFSAIFGMAVTWVLAESFINNGSLREFLTVPISTYIIFLGQSFTFNSDLIGHRILVNLIIFLSILTNFFFTSRLTYLLNGKNMEANIENLDDAMENKLIIGCTLTLEKSYNNTEERAAYLKNHHIPCDYTPKCLLRAAAERDLAVCRTKRRARFLKDLVDNETGKWRVKMIQPPIYVKQVVVFFQKGFPLFSLFNRHLFNLVESGILKVIIERYERRIVDEDFSTPVRKLYLDHLVAPLSLWFFGIVMAALVFLFETSRVRHQLMNLKSNGLD